MINTSKPTTSIANSNKPQVGETWATEPYTWTVESRTWLAISKLISNVSKPTTTLSNVARP